MVCEHYHHRRSVLLLPVGFEVESPDPSGGRAQRTGVLHGRESHGFRQERLRRGLRDDLSHGEDAASGAGLGAARRAFRCRRRSGGRVAGRDRGTHRPGIQGWPGLLERRRARAARTRPSAHRDDLRARLAQGSADDQRSRVREARVGRATTPTPGSPRGATGTEAGSERGRCSVSRAAAAAPPGRGSCHGAGAGRPRRGRPRGSRRGWPATAAAPWAGGRCSCRSWRRSG